MKKNYLAVAITMMLASATIAQPPSPQKPPSQEEKLKHVSERLDKELQLNADQKKNVLEAYKDFFSAMEKVKADNPPPPPPPPPPPAVKQKFDSILKERDAKIKAVLNEEQFKKLQTIEQHMKPLHGDHMPPPPQQL